MNDTRLEEMKSKLQVAEQILFTLEQIKTFKNILKQGYINKIEIRQLIEVTSGWGSDEYTELKEVLTSVDNRWLSIKNSSGFNQIFHRVILKAITEFETNLIEEYKGM